MLLCSACRKEAESHDNAAFVAVPEPETSTYDLDQIQETGELIVATVSGPDTYYDYHGQILGYQYLLATHFAQHIGARLRVELCRDTLELMQTLERGDVDIVAYPLTFTDIGKADLVSCGPVNASDSTSWAVRHDTPLLAKALRSWYTPGLGKKLTAVIPFIRQIEVGFNINSDETWDICLNATFDTLDDVRAYAVHPSHTAVAGALKPYLSGRSCVDYTV